MAEESIPVAETSQAPEAPPAPPSPTWDNFTPPSPPAEPTAPLETVTVTPPTPEPAAPAAEVVPTVAREEGESQTPTPEVVPDEYVAEADDPPEIAVLTTPNAKRWAKRQFKEAEPVRKFLSPDAPIRELGDDLYKRSPSRYWEHVDDIWANHQDYFRQKVAELDSSSTQPAPQQPQTPTATPPSTTTLTEAEIAQLSDAQIVERFNTTSASIRKEVEDSLRAEFSEKLNSLETKFNDVNGKFTTQEQRARERQVEALEKELKTNVMKVVDDAVRESGLELKADDPPKLKGLKQAAVDLIRAQFETTFDAEDENVRVVERVREFAKRLERENVFREEDNLKVRARGAFDKLKSSPALKAILDEITAVVDQSKAKPSTDHPAPPVPGASAGVELKPAVTWDDLERSLKQGASA